MEFHCEIFYNLPVGTAKTYLGGNLFYKIFVRFIFVQYVTI